MHYRMIPFAADALCFHHLLFLAQPQDAARPMQVVVRLENRLSNLSRCQIEALGRLLPALVCAEKSAFRVSR
jgi:hypothetical protein